MGGVNLAGTENLTTQNQITAGFNLASGDRGCVPTFSAVICNIDTPHPQISNSVIHCLNYSYYFRKHHFSSDAQSKFNLVVGYDPAHWCPTNQRHQRDSWPPQAAAPWRPTVLRHRASSGGSPIRTQPKIRPKNLQEVVTLFLLLIFQQEFLPKNIWCYCWNDLQNIEMCKMRQKDACCFALEFQLTDSRMIFFPEK